MGLRYAPSRAELQRMHLSSAGHPPREEVLAQLMAHLPKDMPGGDARNLSLFTNALYADVSGASLAKYSVQQLATVALAAFEFFRRRPGGAPKIHVFPQTLETADGPSANTVIELLNADQPFIVDSVISELARSGVELGFLAHPVLDVTRGQDGSLLQILNSSTSSGAQRESFVHVQVMTHPGDDLQDLQQALLAVMADVRAAVRDFPQMRQRGTSVADALQTHQSPEAKEAASFMGWMLDGNFTFLGYRYVKMPTDGPISSRMSAYPSCDGAGILTDPNRVVLERVHRPTQPVLLRVLKANRRSRVRRPVHMDVVVVTETHPTSGEPEGEHLFVGLFALSAYSSSPESIPILRGKIERVLEQSSFTRDSYNYKTLRFILQTFPRDELFQTSEGELVETALGVLQLQGKRRVALFVRTDPFQRFVSCLVYLPRDRVDTKLRHRLRELLARAYRGTVSAEYPQLGDEPLARLHLIIKTSGGIGGIDRTALESTLADATRSWEDRLEHSLLGAHGKERGSVLSKRYAQAFGASFRDGVEGKKAVQDVGHIERVIETQRPQTLLYKPPGHEDNHLSFKLFTPNRWAPLSEVLPVLENMGLRVLKEVPHEVKPGGSDSVWLQDFLLATEHDSSPRLDEMSGAFGEMFHRVWDGELESDAFNKLLFSAMLGADDIQMLRGYARFMRQCNVPTSQTYIAETLRTNPQIARELVHLFQRRLDPQNCSTEEADNCIDRVNSHLKKVTSLDQDRILRDFRDLVLATQRTNFFQHYPDGKKPPYLVFKFSGKSLELLPKPRPVYEIFVYSPRVEGVHLRFGQVARGGLRWSDRKEDYRTEVLGLVKAQQVKNAVIVPVGSKGGFVSKTALPTEASREVIRKEAVECYRIFIRGLLDVTDNLTAAGLAPPPNTVRHDRDDPYLVVAADKGTATFSDIANQLSRDREFWLDDAFASGGTNGYDHKKMGITARGAWEAVKRHFRELGKNIQSQDFTCVAVGDMSGDVFGNGMLLSRHTRLLAAFNHRHIFIDPNPDANDSWLERQRLFELPGSSWTDYAPNRLSTGGCVYERSAKSIDLSPQAQALLGLGSRVSTTEAINAILKLEVELLFFGGIGTYVKATDETHGQVGDRANDSIRIDATDLRARTVGEGANLGMTQRGRVEYAIGGGRCNTDFIDNSAGVDCSDHEVNIKILLSEVEKRGSLTREQRNELLGEMTDRVAQLVLQNCYEQTQCLTVTAHFGTYLTDRTARFMRSLEKADLLDRAIEFLPDEETLLERRSKGHGFARPELCVLVSYAKNNLYAELLRSSLPDDPHLEKELFGYFPEVIRQRFAQDVTGHRLRREIIATVVSNGVINRMGITFVYEACNHTGRTVPEVVTAHLAVRDLLGLEPLWNDIQALDNRVPAETQAQMLAACARAATALSIWLLGSSRFSSQVATLVDRYHQSRDCLVPDLLQLLSGTDRAAVAAEVKQWTRHDVPDGLATQVCLLSRLTAMGDLAQIAEQTQVSLRACGEAYFYVGDYFGFDWLRDAARKLPVERAWDKQAAASLIEDLSLTQRLFTTSILSCDAAVQDCDVAERAVAWQRAQPALNQVAQLVAELQTTPTPDFPMLAVVTRQLRASTQNA